MRTRLWIVVLILVTAAVACNLPVDQKNAQEEPLPSPTAAEEVVATVLPSPTSALPESPTATPTRPAPVELNYKGLRLYYLPDVFTAFDVQVVPAEKGEPQTSGWQGSAPEFIQIKVTGYPLQNTFHSAQIRAYPIDTFAQINPAAGEIGDNLLKELGQDTLSEKGLPFLPMFNAGQVIAVRGQKVAFQNGSGIRYLTCYAQAIMPIDNACLFYTYQGLTADGNYYLSAIFQVRLAALETEEMKNAFQSVSQEYDQAKYEAYLMQAKEIIAAAPAGNFIPDLDDLDQMMASVSLNPEVELNAPELGTESCPDAIASQVRPDMRVRVTFTDGTPLRVRDAAGKNAAILGQIPEGTEMAIIGGPQCVANGLWWKVKVNGSDLTGWVLEGENDTYYIEPAP